MKNKILLTGGGTAGHVTPNIALIPYLKNENYEIVYIGRKGNKEDIIEKRLLTDEGIEYYGITSGKLRRYFSWENLKDAFRVVKGIFESISLIRKIKPNIVFSKGGFVTVPVILASKLLRVPVIIHESDYTPGLANKISIPMSKEVCVSFEDTLQFIKNGKYTGTPIRDELFEGDAVKAKELCKFNKELPVLLIICGSLGSVTINNVIENNLDKLTEKYNIIHIRGKGNMSNIKYENYKEFEYLNDELRDVFAYADVVISRAGSNSIFELLALGKLNILIPLSKKASRGDQILNANYFEKNGYSEVIKEEDLEIDTLLIKLDHIIKNKSYYIENMQKVNTINSNELIVSEINKFIKQ